MRRRIFAAVLLLLLVFSTAYADWTAPDENLESYTQAYEEAAAKYKLIKYGASSARVTALKEALGTLGYFPYRVSDNFYRTLETAVRLFSQQMRVGESGSEITPLVQAMILDTARMPKALAPVIDTAPYSWEADGNSFAPYTYARLNRSSVVNGVQVGFHGEVVLSAQSGGEYYYAVQMEGDPAKIVYASYRPLPRTTVFQVGDSVAVFGVTQGEQALTHTGMEAAAVLVKADRMGYGNE